MRRKKIALVLSGGAALGFAHIGVVKVLEEYSIPIDIIVGTSMGGLIGAVYALDMSVEKMFSLACKFRKINFIDINFDKSGLFSGKGVMRTIHKFIPDIRIEELNKKFACIACDLVEEKEVIFKNGKLRDAIRATVSIPGFFTPFVHNKKILVDGGVVNNMPDDVAKQMGADVIISVDVLKNCRLDHEPQSIMETLVYSMNVVGKNMQYHKGTCSDIILEPDMIGLSQMSFGKKSTIEAVSRGEEVAKKNIDKIKRLIR